MRPDEVAWYKAREATKLPGRCEPFITPLTDVEHQFCKPEHVGAALNISFDDARQIVDGITTADNASLAADFTDRRSRRKAARHDAMDREECSGGQGEELNSRHPDRQPPASWRWRSAYAVILAVNSSKVRAPPPRGSRRPARSGPMSRQGVRGSPVECRSFADVTVKLGFLKYGIGGRVEKHRACVHFSGRLNSERKKFVHRRLIASYSEMSR